MFRLIITGPDKVPSLLNMYWISPAIGSLHLFDEYNICDTSYRGEGQCNLKAVSGYIIKVWKALRKVPPDHDSFRTCY